MEEIEQGPSPVEVEVKYTLGDFKKCRRCGFLKHKTEEYWLQGNGATERRAACAVCSAKSKKGEKPKPCKSKYGGMIEGRIPSSGFI
jgi:hypothetical protein